MTVQVQLDLQIGSKFYAEIPCAEDQTGRTHRAQIRTAVSTITTKMDLATGSGITIHSTNPKILILEKGATATEAIVCPTDSALWVFDCESLGSTADDKVREAEGPVYVTRDVTRASESTADADASKLFTYSLTDGQTLTTEEQENAREKLGIAGPFSFIVSNGAPVGALGAEIGWYCFDYANGNLYGPLPDYTAPEVPEWPLVGQFGVGTGDSRLSDPRTPTAHTHTLGNLNQSGATTGQVPTWSGSAWAPATPSSGGGMAIGGAITSAVNNRILQSDGSGNLAQQGTWYFDSLGFGAIMPTQQVLRTSDSGGGFIGQTGGGILIGRPDTSPEAFIGAYSGVLRGIFVYPGSGYFWGNNVNDLRSSDTDLRRRDANLIEGACLAMRAYTVGTLPDAATWINAQVVCTNESGGRVPVFSDGTNWRRVTDRATAS